jgi:hypothetical protein
VAIVSFDRKLRPKLIYEIDSSAADNSQIRVEALTPQHSELIQQFYKNLDVKVSSQKKV